MTELEILSVNVSQQKGTVKLPREEIAVDPLGVVGDAHAGRWHRQVSLLARESIDRFAARLGRPIGPGEFGENITFSGAAAEAIAPLDRLVAGDVELEITQIGKTCHAAGCAIFQQVGQCVMPAEGLFARVVRGGVVRRGDGGQHRPRPFTCMTITLSDRAAAGEYADRSGPRVKELLEAFFATRRWHPAISHCVLPDDPQQLRRQVLEGIQRGVDVIFTTGGTGVGPRDIAPDAIAPLCEKLIPGIVEHIRAKFGADNPRARLSRAIAGVTGKTQIYTLPGSVRAVDEYLGEILATMEHLVFMLHGWDVHG